MLKNFITFAAGTQNYIDAGHRLINQVNNLNLFDKLIFYKDNDLINDSDFWNKHKDFINNNIKNGYGYWLWKPYIIKKQMEEMNEGEILLYLDCGCEIDIRQKKIISNFFNYVKADYIIGSNTPYSEKDWNKQDLLLKLNMNDDKYLNDVQRQAGLIMVIVCDKTKQLINEWYEIGCDYHMIDNTPSISKNLSGFIEHRHDQSIFSLLTKKYNLYSKRSLEECIYASRNKTGISKINYNIPIKITNLEITKQNEKNETNETIDLENNNIIIENNITVQKINTFENKTYSWETDNITFLENGNMNAFGIGTYIILDTYKIEAKFGGREHIIIFNNDYTTFESIRTGDKHIVKGKYAN